MRSIWNRIKWVFQKTPKQRDPGHPIWRTPNQTPNIIGMLEISGEGCALVACARIGYGSGYASSLWKVWPDGRSAQVGGYTNHETIGHEMFYGPDGKAIYMPVEHGGNRILIYRNGRLETGAQMPGGWTLAGGIYNGRPVVACTTRYSGSAGTRPLLLDADTGARIHEFPHLGIIWSMHTHEKKLVALNAYGRAVAYRDLHKEEPTVGRVGLSHEGIEWLGGGQNAGRGQEDGNIYGRGKTYPTPCQSSEVARVEKSGNAYIGLINPDRVYQIAKGKPHLIVDFGMDGDKKARGGWAFGIAFAEVGKTLMVGRTDPSGGYVYRC